jgi:hypothetical protein
MIEELDTITDYFPTLDIDRDTAIQGCLGTYTIPYLRKLSIHQELDRKPAPPPPVELEPFL